MKITAKPWIIAVLILLALIVSAFIGISSYKTKTDHIVELSETRFHKFEQLFEELIKGRYRAMGLAADVLLQSDRITEPFEKGDRKRLGDEIDDFFESVHKKHDVEQISFYTAPAILFYRAHHAEMAQQDMSKVRKTVVSSILRQERLMAVETGTGGIVGIRAIVPVFHERKFYGVIEFSSSFHIPLERAAAASKLNWAMSLQKDTWQDAERPNNDKTDIAKKDDIYFDYSDSNTQTLIRDADFDPRAKEFIIADSGDKKIFLHTIKIPNFQGVPTITVAVTDDLTIRFEAAYIASMIQFAVAFVVLSLAFVLIYVMLDAVKSGLLGSAGADRKRMEKQIELGNAAIDKVKEIENIKRRFFSNLMSAISEPLLAITGQLKTVAREIDGGNPAGKPLSFALNEAEQLRYLVSDYEKIEIFRQNLVADASTILSIPEIVDQVGKDSALHQRFPQFKVIAQISGNLPSTRGDNDLMVRALSNLVAYAAQQSGQGEVIFTASQDDDQWLLLTLTGSAFARTSAPSKALLDESRQFLAQIEHGSGSVGNYKSLVGVVLAKLILENFGGSLDVGGSDAPGFVLRLPANQQ